MKHGGVMRNGTQFVNWKNMDCLKLIYIELGLHPEAIGEKNDFFSPKNVPIDLINMRLNLT